MKHVLSERFLATIVHIPIITIIWTTYIWYHLWCYGDLSHSLFFTLCSHPLSSAALPLLLTLASVPISLTVMFAQKRSTFIRENAHQAFSFTLWLLKRYAVMVGVILLGKAFHTSLLGTLANMYGVLISVFCCVQSICGIVTAWQGKIYRYWFVRFL